MRKHLRIVLSCVTVCLIFNFTLIVPGVRADIPRTNLPLDVYEPIPPEFYKITNRLTGWVQKSKAESVKLHSSTNPKVVAWLKAIENIRPRDDLDLMQQINVITNRAVVYIEDYDNYGKKDYWATPYQTLTKGGDCEDIALLKAAALHIRKWDVEGRGALLVGMITWNGRVQPHALLQVNLPGYKSYVIRNLTNDVLAFDDMTRIMKPIYMIDLNRIVIFSPSTTVASTGAGDVAPGAGVPQRQRIRFAEWMWLSDRQRNEKRSFEIEIDGLIGRVYELKQKPGS